MFHPNPRQGAQQREGTHSVQPRPHERASVFSSSSTLFWVCLLVSVCLALGVRASHGSERTDPIRPASESTPASIEFVPVP
jgi:hypothetical protein